jgi:hypothetical protein
MLIANINNILSSEILPSMEYHVLSMYCCSTVLSGSKFVISFLHAASGAAQPQFSAEARNGFLDSFPIFQPGSFHA